MSALSEVDVVRVLRAAGCVFAEEEAALLMAAGDVSELADLVRRRSDGEPLEHILGWAEFCGLRIVVEDGVFVPRRRTEFLAQRAIALAVAAATPVVLDLCCGSGAIGKSIATAVPTAQLYAADIEPRAVHCARRNLSEHQVFEGDLFDPLPADLRGQVDVLVVNAPYVPTAAIAMMPPEARDHEPLSALDGGRDGLDVLRRVIAAAPAWLRAGGHLLFEVNEGQLPDALAALAAAGFAARVEDDDDLGATVAIGQR